MTRRVVVWGTGNAGRPAIRAVAAHRDLELVGVVVANPDKVGRDAGELAGHRPARRGGHGGRPSIALADDVDAVVYTATGDTRPDDALADLVACLAPGATWCRPRSTRCCTRAARPVSCSTWSSAACAAGDSSVFVSGIDPGWALDILPALVSGVGAGITEIRVQELFNYALYDQPAVVREVIGFGGPMDELPLMLLDFSLDMVWAPMVRVLADLLERRARRPSTIARRAPPARAHDRGAGHGHVRGRAPRARSASRCAASSTDRPLAGGRARHANRRRVRARLAAVRLARRRAPGAARAATRTSRSRCTAPSPASRARPAAATPPRPTASSTPSPRCATRRRVPLSPLDLPPITGAAQLAGS